MELNNFFTVNSEINREKHVNNVTIHVNIPNAAQCWSLDDHRLCVVDMGKPTPLTLAAILSDLGSLKACPPALRAGVLSENGTGLSKLPETAMNEEDELVEEEETKREEGTMGQVKEVLRLKKRVETWIKPGGEGERNLKDVEEVEEKVQEVLVEMSEYMDV